MEGGPKAPFHKLLLHSVAEGATPFPALIHFTL